MKVISLVLCFACVANGFGGNGQHHQKPHNPHNPQQQPRYYNNIPPHILASPRPIHPPQYRTLNPGPQYQAPHPHRNARSEPTQNHPQQQKQTPNLVASPSSTPVLVLKKDHTRPVLSSAVVAAAIAEKRQQQAQAQAQVHHDNKPIPTVIMERPGASQQREQEQKSAEKESPKQQEKQETSLETDTQTEEETRNQPSASAERRMFFNSVSQNGAIAHQVSGPQGPQNPRPRKTQHQGAASNIQQQRAQGPRHHELEDDDEPIERITRSNSNPYGQGGFEYPPPQGNYVAQGPTRVPVKYQQGIQGGRPAGPSGPSGKPRPYRQRVQQQQNSAEQELTSEEEEALDLEEQKPDRLQTLLPNSKFTCGGKKDGYYADDSLNCEVFHYCQDGGKHSWLCPDGFAFHQIHLICSPQDKTMCEQSSKFYSVVNSHLYKPINEEEAKQYNTSLKYADRYYPDEYLHGGGDVSLPYHQEEEEEDEVPRGQQHRQQQSHYSQHPQQQPRPRPQPQQSYYQTPSTQHSQHPRPQPQNPYASSLHSHPSYSPSLHSPSQSAALSGFTPSQRFDAQPRPSQQQRIQQAYAQQRSGQSAQSPPKPKSKAQPPQSHPNAFYSPEAINIPLQNRRPIPHHPGHHPQIFKPSPQMHKPQPSKPSSSSRRKYEEDEYEEY